MKIRLAALMAALAIGGLFSGVTLAADDPSRDVAGSAADSMPAAEPASPASFVPEPPSSLVLHNNGPFVTHPGGGSGGADVSALQTALSMTIFGYSCTSTFRLSDDFTVPAGASWRVNEIVVFGYQTGSSTTSTFTQATLRIWNGAPNAGGTIIFGDTTTNRLASSTWTNAYRTLDTALTNTQRPIMRNTITAGVTLTAGTYWIDYGLAGSLASGPFCPAVTILGQTTTGNALQFNAGAWVAITDVGPQGLPFLVVGPDILPAALAVDTTGNNVLQPNEGPVDVRPSWENSNSVAVSNVTGTLSNFTGPAGPLYSITDGTGDYGTIAANSTQQCVDCYAVSVTAAGRPGVHWDSTANEVAGGASKTWTLHVGDSFTDVPASNLFYRFIETILHRSVTGGCTPTTYCPVAETNREQMAVFVLAAKEGPAYQPVACGATPMFADVPVTSPFCRWIEELARRQVVTGCGTGIYCPTAPALRDQMAVFVLKTLDPALNPPACVAGSELFTDVPASSGFCRWVEELSRRGVVSGCGGGAYCPGDAVTREQMSVFLSAGFSLTLYGPS